MSTSLKIDPGMVHDILTSANVPFGEKAWVLNVKTRVEKLDEMLYHSNCFSICDVREIIRSLADDTTYQKLTNSKWYADLHQLHCVNWDEMPYSFRKEVETKVWDLVLPLFAKTKLYESYTNKLRIAEEVKSARVLPWH